LFDDIDGRFSCKLRELNSINRATTDGRSFITFKTVKMEAEYDPLVARKLTAGRLLALQNVRSAEGLYSIYELADLSLMHYSMLTLDLSQPAPVRREFMNLIERDWEKGSKSTWIEMVAAPTGYLMQVQEAGPVFFKGEQPLLVGSSAFLLNDDELRSFFCARDEDPEYALGNLFMEAEKPIPLTVDMSKLIHYHAGVFAYTGAGKSNLTAMVIRKALARLRNLKVVVVDVSSEYAVTLIDLLYDMGKIVSTTRLRGSDPYEQARDFVKRHVVPGPILPMSAELEQIVYRMLVEDAVSEMRVETPESASAFQMYTYGGIKGLLSDMAEDKYVASSQRLLIPAILNLINEREKARRAEVRGSSELGSEDELSVKGDEKLIDGISQVLKRAQVDRGALSNFLSSLAVLVKEGGNSGEGYGIVDLVAEILSPAPPRLFVLDVPDNRKARLVAKYLVEGLMESRRRNYSEVPEVLLVFDEAQEFIPYESKRDDYTDLSTQAVETLLRHGRKYYLSGWIAAQRIARLNTNVLQQLHSYFVGTMPRPYDRQLISDTFAIDDVFLDRTLNFNNGDWFMASFKATNTQNVPVFFHAENNETVLSSRLAELAGRLKKQRFFKRPWLLSSTLEGFGSEKPTSFGRG